MKTKISTIKFLFTMILVLSLTSVSFAGWNASQENDTSCKTRSVGGSSINCKTLHNNGYTGSWGGNGTDFPNGTSWATFNGYDDNLTADGRSYKETQFIYVDPNATASDDNSTSLPLNIWDAASNFNFSPQLISNFQSPYTHELDLTNGQTQRIGFWLYVHNNGTENNHPANNTTMRINVPTVASADQIIGAQLKSNDAKPRRVYANVGLDSKNNIPFLLEPVVIGPKTSSYIYRYLQDGHFNPANDGERATLTSANMEDLLSTGLAIRSHRLKSNGQAWPAGRMQSSSNHIISMYVEFDVIPQEQEELCEDLQIIRPTDAESEVGLVHVEMDENGYVNELLQIDVTPDNPDNIDGYHYFSATGKILFKQYIASTDQDRELLTNNLYAYMDGSLEPGQHENIHVIAVEDMTRPGATIWGECSDSFRLVRPDEPKVCEEFFTNPPHNTTETLYTDEEINVEVLLAEYDDDTPLPNGTTIVYEYSGEATFDGTMGIDYFRCLDIQLAASTHRYQAASTPQPGSSTTPGAVYQDPRDLYTLPVIPNCAKVPLGNTLTFTPETEGVMSIYVSGAQEECHDSFVVEEAPNPECVDLTFQEAEFTPDTDDEYCVDIDSGGADWTNETVRWSIIRDGITIKTLDTTNTNCVTVDQFTDYIFQAGDRLRSRAVEINDPANECVATIESPIIPECETLVFQENLYDPTNDQEYCVNVDDGGAAWDDSVEWSVTRAGTEVFTVTSTASPNCVNISEFPATYTFQAEDQLHAQAVNITDEDNSCRDFRPSNPDNAECQWLEFEDLPEFYTPNTDPRYCVNFNSGGAEWTGQAIEWTVLDSNSNAITSTVTTNNTDCIVVSDEFPNYTYSEEDMIRAVAVQISDPNNICNDILASPPEEGFECESLNIDPNEFNPRRENQKYCAEVTTNQPNWDDTIRWWVERDGDVVAEVEQDYADHCLFLIDLEDEDYEFEPGDELHAEAAGNIVDEIAGFCEDEIPSEGEDCEDFDLDTREIERDQDNEVCFDIDYDDWAYGDQELYYETESGDEGELDVDDDCFTIDEDIINGEDWIEIWVPDYREECEDRLDINENPPDFNKGVTSEEGEAKNGVFHNRVITEYTDDKVFYQITYKNETKEEKTVTITDTIMEFVRDQDPEALRAIQALYSVNNTLRGIPGYVGNGIGEIRWDKPTGGYIELIKSNEGDYNAGFDVMIGKSHIDPCEEEDLIEEGDVCWDFDSSETEIVVYNVPGNSELTIEYIGEIHSGVTPEECSNEDGIFLEEGICGEVFPNTSEYGEYAIDDYDLKEKLHDGIDNAEVLIPCPFILIRSGGDVLFENPFDYGVDTLYCSKRPNVETPIIVTEPPLQKLIQSGGRAIRTLNHRLCEESTDVGGSNIEGYEGVKGISSLICEVSIRVDEQLTQYSVTNSINENVAKLARYEANLNNTSNITLNDLSGFFDTIKSSNNVYYKDKGNLVLGTAGGAEMFLDQGARVIIVRDGDLIINNDIVYKDTDENFKNPKNIPVLAFVVLNGSIIIHPDVHEVSGVFFVQEGEDANTGKICEGVLDAKGNVDASKNCSDEAEYNSETQYVHNGSIYGDPDHIRTYRVKAGSIEEEKSAILIRFDQRIFLNPPAALYEATGLARSQQP